MASSILAVFHVKGSLLASSRSPSVVQARGENSENAVMCVRSGKSADEIPH